MKWTILWIVLMFLSFFFAGLFFANSGMFDEEDNFDKVRTYEILKELDNTPLINIDIQDEDWVKNLVFDCSQEQRNVEGCIEIYQPVCGTVNVQCITEPCDPIKETYPNSCSACSNELVSTYTSGEC
jgi:hypothetical protein